MTAMESLWNNATWPRTASAARPAFVAVLAVMMVLLFGGPVLRGEDDTVVDAAAKKASEAGMAAQLLMLDQQMDGMFFQGLGDAEQARHQWLGRLLLEVSALDAICRLSAAQRAKCETAARLDVASVMDEIEAVRRRYAGRTIDLQNLAGQEEFQRFSREAQAVQARLRGRTSAPSAHGKAFLAPLSWTGISPKRPVSDMASCFPLCWAQISTS
jgi:hypothetical protein